VAPGPQVVVVAASAGAADELATELVDTSGTVVVFAATYPSPILAIDHNRLHKDEIRVIGVEGKEPEDFRIAAALVAKGLVDLSPLIAASFPLEDVARALDAAVAGPTFRLMIEP
jgi:threonine dehydrogenase-like Zn-dependent dehydrogenase